MKKEELNTEAPECASCGEQSSEDLLTLTYCAGGYYLCDDCYYKQMQSAVEGT
jgi:formylmethanofuran dehydrogenase subunit E